MEPLHSFLKGPAQHQRSCFGAGFTLVEMLVVIAIIGILSIVVLTSQGNFNKTIILSNTASDIALGIRSAQSAGISSHVTGAVTNAPFGTDFTIGSSYILFADTDTPAACSLPTCKPGNQRFTSGSDTTIQTYTLNNGMKITNICANNGATHYCNTGGTINGMTQLDVVFSRPNTTATFVAVNGGVPSNGTDSACIVVTSPQGTTRVIKVTYVGQVSVLSAGSCP